VERGFLDPITAEILDHIPAMVWISEPDGRIRFCNRRLLEFRGRSLPEALGFTWREELHPDDGPRAQEALAHMAAGQPFEAIQVRTRHGDGGYRTLLAHGSPRRSQDGKVLHFVGVSVDVTERAQLEHSAKILQSELDHAIRVLAAEGLASGLAHELAQPLNAISMQVSAARRLAHGSRLEELDLSLACIGEETQRAAKVITRFRDLVRRSPLRRSTIDLNKLVREVLAWLQNELDQLRVAVRLRLDESLPFLQGDSVLLRQVLLNLLQNALHALKQTQAATRRLEICTRGGPDEQAEFVVEDSGPGIPTEPEEVDALFRPLFTTKGDGLGMGLSICRTIVEAHGGEISAAPSPLGGAAFRFLLPRAPRMG
jgi:PAS domain S-box-containing protein